MIKCIPLSLALTLVLNALAVFGLEIDQDPQVGDFVRVTFKDGAIYSGNLLELTDTRITLETAGGKLVLLREDIVKIVIIPRAGESIRITMKDGTAYEGKWAYEDDASLYITTRSFERLALLKAQVSKVEKVRDSKQTAPSQDRAFSLSLSPIFNIMEGSFSGGYLLIEPKNRLSFGFGFIFDSSRDAVYTQGNRFTYSVSMSSPFILLGQRPAHLLLGNGIMSARGDSTIDIEPDCYWDWDLWRKVCWRRWVTISLEGGVSFLLLGGILQVSLTDFWDLNLGLFFTPITPYLNLTITAVGCHELLGCDYRNAIRTTETIANSMWGWLFGVSWKW